MWAKCSKNKLVRVKVENEGSFVGCLRCRQNLKFGDFTSSLCRGPQRYLLESVLHVQHDIYALLTNDIIVLWLCRSRSRRRFLNSLLMQAVIDLVKRN